MASFALPALSEGGLSQHLQEIQKFPVLEAQEEYDLSKRWLDHGDVKAAHELVTSHLRLVAKIAMGFQGYGLPLMELISEGNIGLMHAVKRFNPELGFRLSTYATWWIKASIQEYILRSWSLVKIGTTAAQKKLFFNLRKVKNRIQHIEARELVDEDIETVANELNVSVQDVKDMEGRMSGRDSSLNAPTSDDIKTEAIDMLPAQDADHEHLIVEQDEQSRKRAMLEEALSHLNEREQHIIRTRRLEEKPLTLEELSIHYGISRERVRQIEAKAMEKLQTFIQKAQDNL